MKFRQIPPGARFAYRGRTYRKVSPLQGAGDADGQRRLVPRSAEVSLLDADGETIGNALPELLSRGVVEAVLDDYRRRLRSSLARIEDALDDAQLAMLRTSLETADRELWTQLALRSAAAADPGGPPDASKQT